MLCEVVSRKFWFLRFIVNFPHRQILKLSNSQIINLRIWHSHLWQEMQDYKICTVDTVMRRQYVSGIVFHYPDPGAPCFNMAWNRLPVFRTHQGIVKFSNCHVKFSNKTIWDFHNQVLSNAPEIYKITTGGPHSSGQFAESHQGIGAECCWDGRATL